MNNNISARTGGNYMLDVNMIIANNIQAELKKENKKHVDLAEEIGVSKQTMSKIMNGARAINVLQGQPKRAYEANAKSDVP